MDWAYARDLLSDTYRSWSEDKAPRLAAALSYYAVFSVAPMVIIAVAIVGLVYHQEAAEGRIAAQIRSTVGPQAAEAIQEIVRNSSRPSSGILSSIVGVVTLLLGAGGAFGQLQDALNTVWGVQPAKGRSWLLLIKDRALSYVMVLGVGLLLFASMLLSAALAAFTRLVGSGMPVVGPVLDALLSVVLFTVLYALIFRVLPDARIDWRNVWTGALLTSVLFTLGKLVLGWYLGRKSVTSAYGAAGSLVVLLLWVYYSSQILLFGAEFTKVYALKRGARILPVPGAVLVSAEARAEQGMTPLPTPPAKVTTGKRGRRP